MITYILESLAFQLVFLLAYDLFLKKETFFQWNRAYLLGTFALSLILPWVKIQALQTTMPQELETTTVFLTQLNGVALGPGVEEASFLERIPWPYLVLGAGSILATIWFAYKLVQISRLRHKSVVENYREFTKVTVPKSTSAFSFFRNIFMGEEIKKDKEANILAHELVHVKQWHTLDLLFFELARIVFWFNPLVYIYQNRLAELHEFIADEKAVKQNKAAHFEMLLSEAFHTQNISFVNQFFNKSLIKKRIVMLQRKKSKAVWQLKYVLLLPLVLGMLVYTSCENEKVSETEDPNEVVALEEMVIVGFGGSTEKITLQVEDLDALTDLEEDKKNQLLEEFALNKETKLFEIVDREQRMIKIQIEDGEVQTVKVDKSSKNASQSVTDNGTPFGMLDEAPVFPGCEGAEDSKACFLEKIKEHIRKNFRYPSEAQEQGIHGRVSMIFTIDTDGNITNIRKRGPHELLEEEAVRIIKKVPQMTSPGMMDGKAVDVPFSIPITFRLKGMEGEKIQVQETGESVPFATIDEVPVFPGCEDASDKRACFREKIQAHIRKHFRYPEAAQEQGIQGRVSVLFTIDANGAISAIKKRGPHELLENEAERIIGRLPKMQPGKHEGKIVKVPFAIPITFRLQTQPEDTTVNGAKDYMLVSASRIKKQGETFYEGTVTDKESLGLSGVVVSVEGKESGVISNFNGVFSIQAEEGDVLKFQYVGLPDKIIRIPMN
ncbi:M56 family metallopeptidase [Flagellimonas oceanensis]|uniref:M56 family metallopeptidase n=1 Tax=Flagellimonas oceanensis TaxID=2499163 RepID=UPI001F378311|nr:M56 family metallopeptidase [Allomuricauda oceanensis]|tara:strand:+ start:18978 stop:21143 length:2166 start_codon:yes stop_codon:yes gene_type:complete